ncbi:MAG TPA: hypothetical protein VGN69_02210 [Solirubrobacteraceae bacterium]|nr:hypothetical protein [Solirubrobacteraceae bacterium]
MAATHAPPGNSGISEYLETVPDASGGRPAATASSRRSTLPARSQTRLAKLGTDGRAVALLAADPASVAAAPPAQRSPGTRSGTASSSGVSVPSLLGRALSTSEGGVGIALPLILAFSAAAAVVAVARRRRSRT